MGFGSFVKNTWGKVKKFAKGVGKALKGVARVAAGFFRSVLTFDWLRVYLGWTSTRTLQLRVVILSNQAGPVLDYSVVSNFDFEPGTISADRRALDIAIDEARRIFKNQADVVIKPDVNSELVSTITTAAPTPALTPRCNWDGFVDSLGVAGAYYQQNLVSPLLASVTVFVVENVQNKRGCSYGAFGDYTVIDRSGIYDDDNPAPVQSVNPWTLAHEIAHACNLFHPGAGSSLMRSSASGRRDHLFDWQRVILRASHLTSGL